MTTSYDVYCRTCHVGLGMEDRTMRKPVVDILATAAQLASLAEVNETECPVMVCDVFGHVFNLEWFATHKGHDLCVRDEHGRFHDECGAMFTCPSCDGRFHCRLAPGHDGEHRRKP